MSINSYAQKEYELRRELERTRNELRDTVIENKKLQEELKQKSGLISILYSQIDDYQNKQEGQRKETYKDMMKNNTGDAQVQDMKNKDEADTVENEPVNSANIGYNSGYFNSIDENDITETKESEETEEVAENEE